MQEMALRKPQLQTNKQTFLTKGTGDKLEKPSILLLGAQS